MTRITMIVRTADGREISTAWFNGPEFSQTEERARREFQRGVERLGGGIASVRAA